MLKRGLNTCEIIHTEAYKVQLQENRNLKGPETQTNGTNLGKKKRAKKTDRARELHLSNGRGYGLYMNIQSL